MRAKYLQQVDEFVAGSGFKTRQSQIENSSLAHGTQGILITAGGRKLVSSLVVLLKVLRHELGCTLPIEVAYRGSREIGTTTLAALGAHFGPLRGLDLSTVQQPSHHLRVKDMGGWVAKVFALYSCSFSQVLMLDADTLPLAEPTGLFNLPQFVEQGNLFWPDLWNDWVPDAAYSMLGLAPGPTRAALRAGKLWSTRDTESGQLLFDRAAHADVLEYLWWINTFAPEVYRTVHGDKDTLPMAFALAGRAHDFRQVPIPPGGAFRWGEGVLEVRDPAPGTPQYLAGWQLVGCIQYHPVTATPAFLHRTMNKLTVEETPWPIERVTGPIPLRWAQYYLSHEPQGPTKGRWWEHVVPETALATLTLNPTPAHVYLRPGAEPKEVPRPLVVTGVDPVGPVPAAQAVELGYNGCPVMHFMEYARLRSLGLPITVDTVLERACVALRARVRSAEGQSILNSDPKTYITADVMEWTMGDPGRGARELRAPLPALRVALGRGVEAPASTESTQVLARSAELTVVQRAYDSYDWMAQNKGAFGL